MATRWFPVLVVVAAVWCSIAGVGRAAVISIDFGSEWLKVALVKPGVPMEIVLNRESKRKTPAVVSIRNDDRLFGDPALNAAVKHPKSAYRYLQLLVGQKFDSPIVKKYLEWFPFYDIKKDEERGTVLFQHDKDTTYSVEELVAMLFNDSRSFAADYAGVPIRDVVITVPPFFNQAQRRSVLQSASLVGLNVLQLMNENAAAGLNYGLFRQASFNETPHYILFYDIGGCSTTSTIIEYRMAQVKEGTVANVHPQLTIKGIGYDRFLGGLEMEIRLQLHLAKLFQAQGKTKGSVLDSPRAMAKLLKEAKRVKQVLSANVDHFAQIEGLLEDVDFRVRVTRTEFIELCSDLLEKVQEPVQQSLEAADMTMDEIDAVVLMGGGTRVPKIQDNLIKAVKKSELGKRLNTDEAVALGAVYQGAGRTKLFRVKKFIVKEGTVFPIQVSFNRVTQPSTEDGEEEVSRSIKRTLFQRSNTYPSKKVLTFNRHSKDFSFQVFYGDLDFLSKAEKSYLGRLNITEVYLAGVDAALKKHALGDAKGIKAHFNMDESGILNITNVESVFEYAGDVEEPSTLSKIGSSISNFFGMGGEDSPDQSSHDEGDVVHADGNETGTTSGTEEESDGTAAKPDKQGSDSEAEPERKGDTAGLEEEEEDEEPREEEEGSEVEGEVSSEEEGEESNDEEVEVPVAEEEESEDREPSSASEEEPSSPNEEPSASDEEPPTSPAQEASSSDSDSNNTLSSSPNSSNATTNTTKKGKSPEVPKGSVVKVNLTAEVTVLDFPLLSEAKRTVSIEKLVKLQEMDEERVANAKAKNFLEAHIFETKDAMYSEVVESVSTEEQREVIVAALTEAGDWMEDDGYIAETKVYKDKLRELKKISRALFKRVKELELRPKFLSKMASSLNISHDFLERMKNLTSEIQIFTEVEMTTLETLINETEEWMRMKLADQEATSPHEEPALMSYEIEEHTKRLDREIMYLLKKLRSHPPPNMKPPSTNKTNNATSGNTTKTKSKNGTSETIDEGMGPTETSETTADDGGGDTLADDPGDTTPLDSEPLDSPETNSDTSDENIARKTSAPSEEL